MPLVAICITTYNRNQLLTKCLQSIAQSVAFVQGYNTLIIVVDNNTQPIAKDIVLSFRPDLNILYEHESRPGIPFARNRCLRISIEANAEYIAFIDDDEEVDEQWAIEMISAIVHSDADVISGIVLPKNNDGYSPKMAVPNNTIRDRAETGNVIMKLWVAKKNLFDEELSQTGGSDTLFFRQANAQGAIIRTNNKAIARETILPTRCSLKWRLQRHYRYGLVHCIIERKLPTSHSYPFLLIRSFSLIPIGLFEFFIKIFISGFSGSLSGIERACRGLGSLSYFFQIRYYEYKREA